MKLYTTVFKDQKGLSVSIEVYLHFSCKRFIEAISFQHMYSRSTLYLKEILRGYSVLTEVGLDSSCKKCKKALPFQQK